MPNNLRDLVIDLLQGNHIQVECGKNKTPNIELKRGVAQGSPISPVLFNLAIDDIIKNLTEHEIAQYYGFSINPDVANISALAFADDIALIAKNDVAACKLLNLALDNLTEIGLHVNPSKCKIINIKNGHINDELNIQMGEDYLECIKSDETIKYLGVTFRDEIIFDQRKIIKNLEDNLSYLSLSLLLKPDQKLNIINQYIWPSIIYPIQSTPLNKIPEKFLQDVDKLLRSTIKEIIGLPNDCPNGMLYTSKKLRGLGLIKAEWEAHIQHYNIAKRLEKCNDEHLSLCRNLEEEKEQVLSQLKIPVNEETLGRSGRWLRNMMRQRSFEEWCNLPHKGKGVSVYADNLNTNAWMNNRNGLSCSQWTNAIKMSCNTSAVRAVPGRSQHTTLCRHPGCEEPETLGHVLGKCKKGELLRNSRHHTVRSAIATVLRRQSWEVHEEVHCIAENGSHRRADIVAINRKEHRGLILDPTVRMEESSEQALRVSEEKEAIYRPCIPHFSESYNLPLDAWEVKGLLFGARGVGYKSTTLLLQSLGFTQENIVNICNNILRDSLHILHSHLYSNY